MTTLGEVADLTFGFAFKSAEFTDDPSDIRLLRGGNIGQGFLKWSGAKRWPSDRVSEFKKYLLEPDDVIVAMDGMIVQAGLKYAVVKQSDVPSLLVQRVARIRARRNADQVYLGYLIGSHGFLDHIRAVQTGSVVPHISGSQLAEFEIDNLPPLSTQIALGQVLRSLDDKIESNRRVVASVLALARAHVDRAVAGRPAVAYSSAFEVFMGAAFKGDKFSAPGVGRPLLRIRDLKTFESQTWTTETRKDETIIRPGDIVVGMDAEFRATLWFGHDSVLNQRVCSFNGKPCVGRAFVLAALEPELAFQEQAKTGTTVIHLNKADINAFTVPDLSDEDHLELSATTEPLVELAVARAIEARTLAKTRDTLLPGLLTGRIHVTEAADAVGAVA